MAVTPVRPAGTSIWPYVSKPQATTVPSDLRARLWYAPAEMATTFVSPGGIPVRGQVVTVPIGTAAAAGAASGPAETVKSPQSRSTAGARPRSLTDGRR